MILLLYSLCTAVYCVYVCIHLYCAFLACFVAVILVLFIVLPSWCNSEWMNEWMNEFRESSVDLSLRLVHLARARLKAGTAAVTRCWVGGHFAQATLRAGARLQPIIDQPRVTCWLYRPIYHRTHTHTQSDWERRGRRNRPTDRQTRRHG